MIATGGLRSADVGHRGREPARQRVEHPDRRGPPHRRSVVGGSDAGGGRGSPSGRGARHGRRLRRAHGAASSPASCATASAAPSDSGVEVEVDTTGRLARTFYDIYLAWVEHWATSRSCRIGWPASRPTRGALAEVRDRDLAVGRRVPDLRGSARGRAGRQRDHLRARGARDRLAELQPARQRPAAGREHLHPGHGDPGRRESGCRYFDLGQSGGVEDLLRYKRSLGAEPREAVDLRIESPRSPGCGTRASGPRPPWSDFCPTRAMGYQTTIEDK